MYKNLYNRVNFIVRCICPSSMGRMPSDYSFWLVRSGDSESLRFSMRVCLTYWQTTIGSAAKSFKTGYCYRWSLANDLCCWQRHPISQKERIETCKNIPWSDFACSPTLKMQDAVSKQRVKVNNPISNCGGRSWRLIQACAKKSSGLLTFWKQNWITDFDLGTVYSERDVVDPKRAFSGISIGNMKAGMLGAWTKFKEVGFCDLDMLMTKL